MNEDLIVCNSVVLAPAVLVSLMAIQYQIPIGMLINISHRLPVVLKTRFIPL